jgi:predicted phosphodiesterase
MAKKVLAILAALCLLATVLTVGASATGDTITAEDQKYRILTLADVQHGAEEDINLVGFIESALKYLDENDVDSADLVVLLGDVVTGSGAESRDTIETAVKEVLAPIVTAGVPFAVVFGDSDQGDSGLTHEELQQIYINSGDGLCINEVAKADENYLLDGNGGINFFYTVSTEKKGDDGAVVRTPYANLFFFDVGAVDEGEDGPAYVRQDQIDWFNTNNDVEIPAYVFQHIGVPQAFSQMLKSPFNLELPGTKKVLGQNYFSGIPNNVEMVGSVLEHVSAAQNEDGDGEFAALKDAGNVRALFFGNDPRNQFILQYNNFQLVQISGAAWFGTPGSFLVRGGTFITLHTSQLNGQQLFTSDFFTYRQAARTYPSEVNTAINDFGDFLSIITFAWQNLWIDLLAPIRWTQGGF